MRSRIVLAVLVCGAIVARPAAAQEASTRERDRAAIHDLINKVVEVVNDQKFRTANRNDRVKMLEPFYRPDVRPSVLSLDPERGFEGDELPLFFGAPPEPVLSGTKSHLLNTVFSFAQMFQLRLQYKLKVDLVQVLVDTKLATATMLTTSTVTASDGVSQTFRGRSTVVFLKMPDDSWVIGHEHIDLLNPPAPAPGGTRPRGEPTDEEVA